MLLAISIIQIALSIAIFISLIQAKKALFQTQKAIDKIDTSSIYKEESIQLDIINEPSEIYQAVHIDMDDEREYYNEIELNKSR